MTTALTFKKALTFPGVVAYALVGESVRYNVQRAEASVEKASGAGGMCSIWTVKRVEWHASVSSDTGIVQIGVYKTRKQAMEHCGIKEKARLFALETAAALAAELAKPAPHQTAAESRAEVERQLAEERFQVEIDTLHSMPPKAMRKAFALLPEHIQQLVTEPCCGDAHTNAYIDNCCVCLGLKWGRMLKPSSLQLAQDEARAAQDKEDAM